MKLLKYLFVSSVLLVATSCGNNWLDLDPSTSVDTETSIKILSDVEFTLNGIYSTMQSSDAYSGRLVYYGDVTADDMQAVSSTKRVANYYRFNFTKDNGPTSHWSYLYSIIQNCNLILMNIDKLKIDEEDAAYRDDLKGEALALRGLALFDLTRIFGYPYTKNNGASLGVPIIEGLSTIDSKPTRNTVAQCYEKIIDDLTKSTKLLSGKFNKGKINKWGAMVLLSRVYLYKNDNTNAFNTAKEAIEGAEKQGYALWTNEEYPTAWGNDASASNPGEVLFEIVNLTTDSPGKESMGYLNSKDGYDDMCITCSFYQFLKEDPNDVRLKLLSFDKKYYAYIFKYQPQQNENIEDANIPLIRLSEAYLIAAEAAVKLNDNDAAVDFLDPIVRRANPDKTVQGEKITLERVLNERRKELVAEGHRMYDAVRNGLTIERVNVTDKNLSKTKHDTKYMKDINWDFYMIVLPIPKREMDANPNMEQNPEYGN
ncbi:RagB/SusD family nutrient uptake outer membrane protein [Bacteroides stercorirosoris]|uniref:RagB/SusD family nutrient uptake outer membrane protein n=1 Tax=Bacteroides stercorirosoris TaxID=871324 RepID=UPI0023F28A08|nr:RagB/SusD family nutrient uptake outer membrane protein [Bacteroides stercorirosoris]